MNITVSLHSDLITAQELAYTPSGFSCNTIQQEIESQEYGACTFKLNNKIVIFRVGKSTPTKVGHFVTLWKRIHNGPITPYHLDDAFDVVIMSVRDDKHFGQFVFPKRILEQKNIISTKEKNGKLAIRVYAPWIEIESPQAKKTQAWQNKYFFEIQPVLDICKIQLLLGL